MRLAISNLAWDISEDEVIAELLQRFGVDAIDVVPGKYFPVLAEATDSDIARVKNWWTERGIEIAGMQALLFGTTGLNIFGQLAVQDAMQKHLAFVCRIGAGLGATRLAFGSPKNRDRTGLSDQETIDIAVPFFRRLGDTAQFYGVAICLEPNPPCYGANFLTTSAETAQMVALVAHPSVRMLLDTGALTINAEDASTVLADCANLVGHVHVSEPGLLPLGEGGTNHAQVAASLTKYLPDHLITIEMLATKSEAHDLSIRRAVDIATRCYRDVKRQRNVSW